MKDGGMKKEGANEELRTRKVVYECLKLLLEGGSVRLRS